MQEEVSWDLRSKGGERANHIRGETVFMRNLCMRYSDSESDDPEKIPRAG